VPIIWHSLVIKAKVWDFEKKYEFWPKLFGTPKRNFSRLRYSLSRRPTGGGAAIPRPAATPGAPLQQAFLIYFEDATAEGS
jgi:hypothetical protein